MQTKKITEIKRTLFCKVLRGRGLQRFSLKRRYNVSNLFISHLHVLSFEFTFVNINYGE